MHLHPGVTMHETIIPLGSRSPGTSSDLPADVTGRFRPIVHRAGTLRLFGLAAGGVCLAVRVTTRRGALLPHHFTLTSREKSGSDGLRGCLQSGRTGHAQIPSRPHSSRGAVSFLLHFPSDCSALTLSSTVPCAVRTFLMPKGWPLSQPRHMRPSWLPQASIIYRVIAGAVL
jgi:hypothetical protein